MTPDKHLLYKIHKYTLQSLPSPPAMPAFPTAAFHPSLLQAACTNLSQQDRAGNQWMLLCFFPPWEVGSPLHGPGGSDTGIVMLPIGRWLSMRASWSKKPHREEGDMLRSHQCSARQREEPREEREGNFPSPVLSPATLVGSSHSLLPRASPHPCCALKCCLTEAQLHI